jgi:hypothetical protein
MADISDDELDDLMAEVVAADAEDAGEEADLPEGVPLPEEGEQTAVLFLKKKRTAGDA